MAGQITATKPQQDTAPAVIANAASVSVSYDLGAFRLCAIVTPAALDSTTLAFQASADGTNFAPLYDSSGTEVTLTVANNAARFVRVDPATFYGVRFLKILMGTNAAPVAATAQRAFTLVVEG